MDLGLPISPGARSWPETPSPAASAGCTPIAFTGTRLPSAFPDTDGTLNVRPVYPDEEEAAAGAAAAVRELVEGCLLNDSLLSATKERRAGGATGTGSAFATTAAPSFTPRVLLAAGADTVGRSGDGGAACSATMGTTVDDSGTSDDGCSPPEPVNAA